MMPRMSGVIKKGFVQDGPGLAAATPAGTSGSSGGGALPRARLVEQREGMAIVEVVCACGRVMMLQCEYA